MLALYPLNIIKRSKLMQPIKTRQKEIRRAFKSLGLSVNFKVYPYQISFKGVPLFPSDEMCKDTEFETLQGLKISIPPDAAHLLYSLIDDIEANKYF